jgi:hypothetical protein
VDGAVDHGAHVCVARVAKLDDDEPAPDEEAVVVHVQKGDLVGLLAQDHPQRVEELDEPVTAFAA